MGLLPGWGRSPGGSSWKRTWQPTPVFFPGESHGQRGLEGYSLQYPTEADTTEVTQLACIAICNWLFSLGITSLRIIINVIVGFFSLLNNISWYRHTMVGLTIRLVKDICFISTSWQLCIDWHKHSCIYCCVTVLISFNFSRVNT